MAVEGMARPFSLRLFSQTLVSYLNKVNAYARPRLCKKDGRHAKAVQFLRILPLQTTYLRDQTHNSQFVVQSVKD